MSNTQIIGAGLAGLIVACAVKDAPIYEAGAPIENHKALLRFRDKSVSELTGIPFEEVTVRKEINYKGKAFHQPTIAMANMYSRKVAGVYRGRSVWDLDTVKRYIAPDDFHAQLVERHSSRIHWQKPIYEINGKTALAGNIKTINTAPLPVIMKVCGLNPITTSFEKSSIVVSRYRLPEGTKVFQTIYFPASDMRVFRASITGDMLIVESMTGNPRDSFCWADDSFGELHKVLFAFGLESADIDHLESVEQRYGKIVELPRETREAILYELTHGFNVFSVGRFATWRNILLDDVVKDIQVVQKLMKASEYGRGLVLSGRQK